MIISEKVREEEMLLKDIADTTMVMEVAQISSFVLLARRYN